MNDESRNLHLVNPSQEGAIPKMKDDYFLRYIYAGDNSGEAKYFYKSYFEFCKTNSYGDFIDSGDTWFTPYALLDGLDKNSKNPYMLCDLFKNGELPYCTSEQIKISLLTGISKKLSSGQDIIKDYSCLANFGFLAGGKGNLNQWRGAFNRFRLGDFPDLFFECVKSFLENKKPNDITNEDGIIVGYSSRERDELEKYEWWFSGDEKKGIKGIGCAKQKDGKWDDLAWETFITKMHLKGSFVEDNSERAYPIKMLFSHDIGYPFPNLDSIWIKRKDIYTNGYTEDELIYELTQIPEIKCSFCNIYDIWNKRAEALSKIKPLIY